MTISIFFRDSIFRVRSIEKIEASAFIKQYIVSYSVSSSSVEFVMKSSVTTAETVSFISEVISKFSYTAVSRIESK